MFDKQIHKDDYRLRLLVTNGCNKACDHCLNDFQDKPKGGVSFLKPEIAEVVIKSYCAYMGDKAQVEISGGEPGTHPDLKSIVKCAKEEGAFVKVNTNGEAFGNNIEEFVDCWHIGVDKIEPDLIDDIVRVFGQVQFVVTYDKIGYMRDIVKFYGYYDIPIKLFVDVLATGEEQKEIGDAILYVIEENPHLTIKTRFVGVQENRGSLCESCNKKCITLKALWVFPDGKVSPCPQGVIEPQSFSDNIIEATYSGHKVGEE